MINYVLAPSPTLQLTDNNGNWVPYGRVRTLDWNTRQPKATYYDPGGLKPRENPFRLDSVGRAFEVYWEDDSAYYLELQDRNGLKIWSTAEPFVPSGGGSGPVTNNIELVNLFINGQMRFFPVGKYEPIPSGNTTIADGGWTFDKDGTNLVDGLEFVKFTPDNIDVDASPTYYLRYFSTGPGSGETKKDLGFRFQDVRTLANEQVTVSLAIRSALAGTFDIEVFAVQYFGSASPSVTPSPDVVTPITTINPTTSWAQYTGTITLPNLIGKTIGENGDDALFIYFRMPLNSNADLELTDFYFKRGASTPFYPYISYEEEDATIKALKLPQAAPYTDFPSFNYPVPFDQAYHCITLKPMGGIFEQSWLPPVPISAILPWLLPDAPPSYTFANGDILIKNGQYSRLFGIIGEDFTNTPILDTVGSDGPAWGGATDQVNLILLLPGQTNSVWSIGDSPFTYIRRSVGYNGNQLTITSSTANTFIFTNNQNGGFSPVAATDSAIILNIISNGSPSTPAEWAITGVPATSIVGGTYIAYDFPTNPQRYIYFIKDGVGVDPAIPGRTGTACNVTTGMDDVEVAATAARAIAAWESGTFTVVDGASIEPGQFFLVSSISTTYQPYFRIDGSPNLPSPITGETFPIDISSTSTATEVATAIYNAFAPLLFQLPNLTTWALASSGLQPIIKY